MLTRDEKKGDILKGFYYYFQKVAVVVEMEKDRMIGTTE